MYRYVCIYSRGNPKNWNLFILKLCIYFYIFILQKTSKYSPFDAIHLLRLFLLLKTVFELIDFDVF